MPTMLTLGNAAVLAACVVSSAIAGDPERRIARRQDQYASFSNSSSASTTVSDSSSRSSTSVASIAADASSSSSADSSSSSSSSSSSIDEPYFTYSPQTSTSISPSPAPSITSIVRTSSGPDTSYDLPSGTAASLSDPSSAVYTYAPTTASRVTPPVKQQCLGQTVNVQNASFDWWNPMTIDHVVSTLSFQHDSAGIQTGWTILPAGEQLTLSNEFQRYDCDENKPVVKTDTDNNDTYTMFECSWVPITIAAATTATTVTAFEQPTATTGTSLDVPPNIRPTRPADPSTTFPAVNATFAPGANFVYFNNYEIESGQTTTFVNGSGACLRSTASYNLSAPYALTYTGSDPELASEPAAAVTGDLDAAFLSYIGHANATAGHYTALPTAIIVIEEIFKATVAFYIAKSMATAQALDTPTAVLPSGFTKTATADNDNSWVSDLYTILTASARVESTAEVLLVPPPSSTKDVPVLSQAAESTKKVDNNTPIRVNDPTSTPADANDVLSDALNSAILQGLGATLAPSTTKQNVNIAGSTGTPTSVQAVVVGGQTAVAGGAPIVVGGTTVSIPAAGDSIVVGGTTTQFPAGPAPTFVVDGIQLTATKASAFSVAGQTLVAGGSQITVGGSQVSLVTGGNALVVGSSTLMLVPPPVITIGSATITADAATRFVLGPGQTLTPGGFATVSGTTVSLDRSGTAIVVNGQTSTVRVATANSASAITVGGQVFTATSGATYVIAGQTLTPGGVKTVTIAGSTYVVSLAATPTAVVIQNLGSNGRATATSTEYLLASNTGAASAANKSPTTAGTAAATSAPATGQASSTMMELLTALFGAAALAAAAFL